MEFLYPFFISFILIFLSELGDKTQLLVLSFSTKDKAKNILFGVALGTFFSHGLAILFGSQIGSLENETFQFYLELLTYSSFLLFGIIGFLPKRKTKVDTNSKTSLLQKISFIKLNYIAIIALSIVIGELVPAFKARSLGFDGSMVAAYGQDDKVCAYTSLHAMMELENVKNTAVCILSDKEEIGSMGNTGMESHMFDFFISEILNKLGVNRPNLLDKVFCFSKMLSSDVDAGFDPIYASVSDKHNAGFLGKGISLNKYTGARGKSGASDANAEYVAWVRNILERNDIKYQIAELGKVDIGGGGTIAYIIANKGADVIDCGVPVLSMHAPYEVTSKYDIYSAYKTYKAFWEE